MILKAVEEKKQWICFLFHQNDNKARKYRFQAQEFFTQRKATNLGNNVSPSAQLQNGMYE